jgi:hypothetical protein
MTKGHVRGYAAALTLLGFSSAWAATAHSPWPKATTASTQPVAAAPVTAKPAIDPRVAALNRREARLRRRAAQVRQTLSIRRAQAAARAPVVRYVRSAPVTVTRTS